MTDRELMQQALDALELLAWYENPATKVQVRKPRNGGPIVTMYPHKVATEAAAPLRERLAQPDPDFYGYASRLAAAIWEQHYKDVAPQWKPLDDLIGVLTQIDNMTAGLTRLAQPEQEPVATVRCINGITIGYLEVMQPVGTKLYTTPPQRKPEQEPVSGVVLDEHGSAALVKNGSEDWHCKNHKARRLYTTPPQGIYYTPPQRTWVGLTDEEIKTLPQWFPSHESAAVMPLIRAFEAKLREKNT